MICSIHQCLRPFLCGILHCTLDFGEGIVALLLHQEIDLQRSLGGIGTYNIANRDLYNPFLYQKRIVRWHTRCNQSKYAVPLSLINKVESVKLSVNSFPATDATIKSCANMDIEGNRIILEDTCVRPWLSRNVSLKADLGRTLERHAFITTMALNLFRITMSH